MAESDAGKSGLAAAPRRRKAPRKPTLELFHWKDLPEYLKDNEFIFSGYRANTGVWGSFTSLFKIHNESGNVWSHLTGFVFFIFLLVCIIRSPPTPLALQQSDLEVLWDAVAVRIENASDSLRQQVHSVNAALHEEHARQRRNASAAPTHALPPANASQPARQLFRSLKSIQHSLVDAVHGLETRVGAFAADLQLPGVPGALQSTLASVANSVQDGVESVQHTFQHGLESVQHTVRDGWSGAQLKAVRSGVRELRDGVSTSWARLSGTLAHNLHSLEDFVACRLPFQSASPLGLPSGVLDGFQWMRDAADDILHRAVLGSVQWPVPRWPLYIFMAGVMTCLLVSAVAHLFGCCSQHVAAFIWRFDYAGIVANIVSSFYPSVFYAFMCEPAYQWIYLLSVTVCGGATLALSLLSCFQTTRWRSTRASAFAVLGLLGIIPYVHILIVYPHFDKLLEVVLIDLAMAAFYLVGAMLYAQRIPERWAPGKFDLWLHSHQLFHLCVIGGAYCHYLGVIELLKWRDASGGCALEVVDREMVKHAVQGGANLVDVQVVVEYLQQRLHEYLHLPPPVVCHVPTQHNSFELMMLSRFPTCPAS